jgi:transposase-like protein
MENPTCPFCGGAMWKRGFAFTKKGKYQRYICTKCGSKCNPLSYELHERIPVIIDKVLKVKDDE